MEQELLVREDVALQASGFVEQAIYNIYKAHPHEVKLILYTALSLIFGYSAYKEYELTVRTAETEEV